MLCRRVTCACSCLSPASQSVAAAGSLPRTSSFVGTPPYMAPEALARAIKNDHEWILADWW